MFPPQLVATFATFHADTVHIICDAYSIEPTINDSKRDRRENTEATYSIQGCDQTRPTNFNSTLLSTSFKFALIEFIAYKIRSQHYKDIINEKTVFYTLKQSYIKVQVDNNEVIISGVDELSCSHNEADARYAAENTSSPHIVVRASDTGTFILLFHFASQLDDQIWMHTGSSSLKTRRNIDISNMAIVCAALPGFHVFTGSDYTASFMRIGKVRQFDVMIKMINSSRPLLDWVIQTFSLLKCLPPWSSTFVLSMVSPIHQELMQRDTKYSAKCMLHILVTNHWRK